MNTIVGDQSLHNSATLDHQQQTKVQTTGDSATLKQADDSVKSATTPATIVTLGSKQDAPVTYSKASLASNDYQAQVLGGIRKPPPEQQIEQSLAISTQTTAPDSDEASLVGGIKKPPPQADPSLTNSITTTSTDETDSKVLGGIRKPPP